MQVESREVFQKPVTKLSTMTALEKQMAEALRRIADPRNTHFAGDAQVVAREALALFDAQAAEQAAGGGEAVNGTTTGEINGRHYGIRPAVHGRVALGGYTPGALADLLFASDDVMSLNAKLDLTMDQLVPLAQAVLSAISIHLAPAAPVQQVGELPPLPDAQNFLPSAPCGTSCDWDFEEREAILGGMRFYGEQCVRAALSSQPAAQTARTEVDELALLEQLKQKYAPLSPFATEQRMKSQGSFFYVRSAAGAEITTHRPAE